MFGKLFLPRVMYTFMRYECTLYQAFKNKESIAPTTFFYDVKTFDTKKVPNISYLIIVWNELLVCFGWNIYFYYVCRYIHVWGNELQIQSNK